MRSFLRWIGFISLIALFINGTLVFAQEDITVVGSGIVAPAIEAAAETSDVTVATTVTGTDRGIEMFCQNQADIMLATRPLTTDEEFNCTSSSVQFLELLVGYNAIAFVSSPDAQFNECLTTVQLNTLLAPSEQGQVTDWSQVNAENTAAPISLVVPSDDTAVYAALDALVEGIGIRGDVQVAASDDEALSAVGENVDALAVVSFANAAAASERVRILQLNTGAAGCTTPSLESIEGREYSGADRLLVYVNSASLSKAGMNDLLNAAFSANARESVEGLGLVAPSDDTYTIDQGVIAEVQTGRRFSRDIGEFTIPLGLLGSLSIGGSTVVFDYMQSVTSDFTAQEPNITIDQSYLGEPDGFRRLCNGELDIAVAYSELSAEQADNCAANNVTPFPLDLGSRSVVLLANADSDYLTCLTTEQLATVFSATSTNTITAWNQVSSEFPETAMTLFAPQTGNPYTDLLMFKVTGTATPSRVDTQLDDEAAYRAAATANVEGALTYMNWAEYQTILENEQANIVLVSVDSGDGCIEPSESSISDGSYTLAEDIRLIVKRSAIARPEVQALLWFIMSDENFSLITDAGLVGLDFADLADLRFDLQNTFTEVQLEAATITPESTAEATPESAGTAEAPTDESTPQATETATEEPTQEATEVVDETPTEAATPEEDDITEVPTEEATPEATEASS